MVTGSGKATDLAFGDGLYMFILLYTTHVCQRWVCFWIGFIALYIYIYNYIYIYIRARVKHRKTRLSEDALKDPDSTHEK